MGRGGIDVAECTLPEGEGGIWGGGEGREGGIKRERGRRGKGSMAIWEEFSPAMKSEGNSL